MALSNTRSPTAWFRNRQPDTGDSVAASRIKLGHNQQFLLNGVAMEGARELDLNVTSRQVDITGVNALWATSLPVSLEVELTVTLYYPDEISQLYENLCKHPKTAVTLAVPDIFQGNFIVSSIKAGVPMGDVVSHEVTFKAWGWN